MKNIATRFPLPPILLLLAACTEGPEIQASEPASTPPSQVAAAPAEKPATEPVATPPAAADVDLPENFQVLEVYLFVPSWEGAEGFSAGGKYIIQGTGFNEMEERRQWSDGESFVLLPQDGSPATAFEIVAGSLRLENAEVRPVEHAGRTFGGDTLDGLIPRPQTPGLQVLTTMAVDDRPEGESQHEFGFGIDNNGDGNPEYVEFLHHCKKEIAPYPMDQAAWDAWDAEHGEIDWDYTCRNIYTRRDGKWTKGIRKTPA